jgi:CDP-diglyceride synthetase
MIKKKMSPKTKSRLGLVLAIVGAVAVAVLVWYDLQPKALPRLYRAMAEQVAPSAQKLQSLSQTPLDTLDVANAWSELILGSFEKLCGILATLAGAWQFLKHRKEGKK